MNTKKILIATFVDSNNYGALLQAFGLQEMLKRINCEPSFVSLKNGLEKEKLSFPARIKNFIRNILYIDRTFGYCVRKNKTKTFKNQYLNILKRKYSNKNLKSLDGQYDAYVVGSDQVWNMYFGQNSFFFLDFVTSGIRISYAASFGYDKLPTAFEELTRYYLSKFNYISVRENSGVSIINELQIGKTASKVLDPTFLLNEHDWNAITKKPKGIRTNGNYILVYCVLPPNELLKCAVDLSKEKNLPLIIINNKTEFKIKNAINCYDLSVNEFVWLFRNASYIYTTSFHGISLSINFKKQFMYETPESKVNDRVFTISTLFKLESRDIKKNKNIDECINWDDLEKIKQKEIDKSISFLKQSIFSENSRH